MIRTEERVDQELEDLEERSALYLSLGPGQKALGGTIRQTDAKHQHALLSVVNQKTLELLMELAQQADVELRIIEPSLSALSRVLGHCGADADGPTLIVNVNDLGVEVGITHEGQLLLDYRPTGDLEPDQIAETITHHLSRLQRYCDRYVRFTNGRLDRAVLCGHSADLLELRDAFTHHGSIRAEVATPDEIDETWDFSNSDVDPSFCPALGAMLLRINNETSYTTPNLLERIASQSSGPLIPGLIKAFLPLAAAIALAAGAWVLVFQMQRGASETALQIATFERLRIEANELDDELSAARKLLSHYETVDLGLVGPQWHQLSTTITQCLPDDTWLESLEVDADGRVVLKANTYNAESMYKLRDWLRKYPGFSSVALREADAGESNAEDGAQAPGAPTSNVKTKAVTRFDIQCQLAGRISGEESDSASL